jgi:hypothetical protein
MAIWVKIWLSLVICVKYAQCVKIWPFVWKFDFHCIFMWNMFNVWKYGHLSENLTFIGYLCEICSMCENMVIWCLIYDKHYTKSGNCLVSDEEKGRCALSTCVSHLRKRETRYVSTSHIEGKRRCVLCERISLLLNCTKRNINRIFSMGSSLHQHQNDCLHMCMRAHV